MARSYLALALALTALFPASLTLAEPPPPPPVPDSSPAEVSKDDWHGKKDRGPRDKDKDRDRRQPPGHDDEGNGPFDRFKKRLEQMSPEERQHFQDNLKRWKQMGDNERKDWQQRAMDERDRMKKIIDDTIQKLGLKLDPDQREVFVLRYRQERRKIEEQLCKEMTEKRDREVSDMLQRLKVEFSAPKPTPVPAASPVATP